MCPCHVISVTSKGCFHFTSLLIDYDECWIYTGPAYWIKGYPIIHRHGKNWIVSRFVWYFLTGRDYRGKEIHHECKIRACCNPFHLKELTAKKHKKWHNK